MPLVAHGPDWEVGGEGERFRVEGALLCLPFSPLHPSLDPRWSES